MTGWTEQDFGGNEAQKLRTEHTYISSASCHVSGENRMQWKENRLW